MSAAPALKITPPAQGAKIIIANGKLSVPVNPIVPFIEGDGTGPDIWRASVRVLDAAVERAYGGKRRIPGRLADDDLDEHHALDRREEMHADEARRSLR